MKFVKWFNELTKEDVSIAGGKGANLGEMTQAKIPVPPGFVVLSSAYYAFLEHNHLRPEIHRVLSGTDVADPQQLNSASKKIEHLLRASEIPPEVSREIFSAYHELNRRNNLFARPVPVACRSSATAEDLPEASFAGQQESYLNVIGVIFWRSDKDKFQVLMGGFREGQTFHKVVVELREIKGDGKVFGIFVEHIFDGVGGAFEVFASHQHRDTIHQEFGQREQGVEVGLFLGEKLRKLTQTGDGFNNLAAGKQGGQGDYCIAQAHAGLAGGIVPGVKNVGGQMVFICQLLQFAAAGYYEDLGPPGPGFGQ